MSRGDVRPVCRYCGDRVAVFGAICSGCDPEHDHAQRIDDGSDALVRAARIAADRLRP